MNNDLISRKALREDLRRFFPVEVLEEIEPKTLFAQIMHDIDNATPVPQVTVCCENADEKTIEELKAELERVINEVRPPQGEWIFLKANEEQTDGYECSVCKTTYHTRVPYFSEFNFCPNCGADMRGKEK